MAKPRSAIAVRGTTKTLIDAALKAFSSKIKSQETAADFDAVIDFTQIHSEELGGNVGEDGWHVWQVGDYAVLGDLSLACARDQEALMALSSSVGEVTAALLDTSFGDLLFAVYEDGRLRRLLAIEDDELYEEGSPVVEERGHFDEEFDEEALERLWTTRGLPTFEHDPLDGPFEVLVIEGA